MALVYLETGLLVLFNLIIFFILISFAYAGLSAAPWVPLRSRDASRLLEVAEVKPGELVYDLGSGDGRILILAASKFGAKAEGFELSILPYLLSRLRIGLLGLGSKVQVHYRNFFKQNLSRAQIVTLFLTPAAMVKLSPKFRRELRPGTRIVSYAFALKDWQPVRIDKPDANTASVYLYLVE